MTTTLAELFKHNLWANLRLLDHCAGLSDEQLSASVPGTYGTIRATLIHLLAAEERYVALLTGEPLRDPLGASDSVPTFDELRARARRSGEALIELSGRLAPTQILTGTRRGQSYAVEAAVPLVQAINHATEHRAHVMTILTQIGIEPPVLDGWAYGEEHGLSS